MHAICLLYELIVQVNYFHVKNVHYFVQNENLTPKFSQITIVDTCILAKGDIVCRLLSTICLHVPSLQYKEKILFKR